MPVPGKNIYSGLYLQHPKTVSECQNKVMQMLMTFAAPRDAKELGQLRAKIISMKELLDQIGSISALILAGHVIPAGGISEGKEKISSSDIKEKPKKSKKKAAPMPRPPEKKEELKEDEEESEDDGVDVLESGDEKQEEIPSSAPPEPKKESPKKAEKAPSSESVPPKKESFGSLILGSAK